MSHRSLQPAITRAVSYFDPISLVDDYLLTRRYKHLCICILELTVPCSKYYDLLRILLCFQEKLGTG